MAVVLPAPLGPRKPKISPFLTEKLTSSFATIRRPILREPTLRPNKYFYQIEILSRKPWLNSEQREHQSLL